MSGTTTVGTSVGRVPSTATAPPSTAAAAKSWPSTRSPTIATNSPPSTGSRLSRNASPVTVTVGVAVHLAAHDLGDLGQRHGDHASTSSSARTTSRSSKGSTTPATSWPVS